ncbi:aminoglycoside phosphotransferase family protein [Yoonia sp. 2307UL14-13]|uniref:aminoglycoside phosphotransferase family protein n=1 Tax=Yoonia sp. 2307UL14-13 TaxID=3126506 RepID=UPI0030AD341A
MNAPDEVLADLHLSDPVFVTETAIAHVWKVRRKDGFVALKIYKHRDPKGEDVGAHLMRALNGSGMARLDHFADGVALIAWLDGPTLGDLSRAGQDDTANMQLIGVADQIHQAPTDLPLIPLVDQFAALIRLQPEPHWSDALKSNMLYAQGLAAQLLESQNEVRPLHGDLHHDNIIQTADECRAIDPKGLIGDRAYDLANAFKNPVGAPKLYLDPSRARHMADRWAAQWRTTPKRLLGWAVAHCALSITWANAFDDQTETAILAMLLELYHGQF